MTWLALFFRQLRMHRPPWATLRDGSFWWRTLGAGTIVGLAIIWPVALARTNNGCTGVSDAYEATISVTLWMLYGFGPAVLASHLRAWGAASDQGAHGLCQSDEVSYLPVCAGGEPGRRAPSPPRA
jgi:hypothetical protein